MERITFGFGRVRDQWRWAAAAAAAVILVFAVAAFLTRNLGAGIMAATPVLLATAVIFELKYQKLVKQRPTDISVLLDALYNVVRGIAYLGGASMIVAIVVGLLLAGVEPLWAIIRGYHAWATQVVGGNPYLGVLGMLVIPLSVAGFLRLIMKGSDSIRPE